MKKTLSLLLVLVMVLSLFAGCGNNEKPVESQPAESKPVESQPVESQPAESQPAEDVEKTLTIGLTTDVTPLSCIDPSNGEVAGLILQIMYPTLVTTTENENGQVEILYQLLESISTEDNITFSLKLRDNMYWSDGEKITAEDLFFTLDLLTDPATNEDHGATNAFMLADIVDEKKGWREAGTELTCAEVVDELTLNITCNGEYATDFVLGRMCYNTWILPEHVLGKYDHASALTSDEAYACQVVSGAFKLHSYKSASELVLEANENYYQGAPKLDYIRFVFTTASQITTQLASGDVDMAWPGTLDATDYAYVASLENVVTEIGAPTSMTSLFINNERIPDANVRKAISLAINRQAIVDGILEGYAQVSNLPVSPASVYYNSAYSEPEYNPELAKQLIADSGFNTPLTLTVGTGKTTTMNIAAMVQASLQAIGLQVEIKTSDKPVLDIIFGDYDMSFCTQTEQPLLPTHTLSVLVPAGNWCKYNNAETDALYATLTAPLTQDEMTANMYRVQEICATEFPAVALYNSTPLLAKTTNIIYGGPADFGMMADVHLWDIVE